MYHVDGGKAGEPLPHCWWEHDVIQPLGNVLVRTC